MQYLIIFIFTVFTAWMVLSFTKDSKHKKFWFNGKQHDSYSNNTMVKQVEFEVDRIDTSFNEQDKKIAKYTVSCFFFGKKNNKDWRYNEFVFFDDMDKYHVGDRLTLTLKK